MARRILVVDDDRAVAALVVAVLRRAGFETSQASGYTEGVRALETERCDAVVSDLFLGEGKTGLDLMRARAQRVPFIVMTGMADLDTSVEALKAGAVETIAKPLDLDKLVATVQKAVTAPREAVPPDSMSTRRRIVGRSKAIVELFNSIGRAAMADTPVLITGEEGVGKDFVAQEIHRHGPHSHLPLESILCTGLPAAEFDVELQRASRDGGTVLLKHVDELPPRAQALLASRLSRGLSARLIGTARSLSLADDLRYALAVVHLNVPPLRERTDDIAMIVEELLREVRSPRPLALSDEAFAYIKACRWTGNVRQLAFALRAAAARSGAGVIDKADLCAVLSASDSDKVPDEPTFANVDTAPRATNRSTLLYKCLAKTTLSEVWAGWQPSLWRKVVVKYLVGSDHHEIERFKREARIHASLKHAGIPAVHEVGVDASTGRRFIVLEFIEGTALSDYNRRLGAAIDEEERIATVVRIIASVAGVLSYLHGKGIIHRDVKPHNILVTPSEQPLLIDYGMARTLDGGDALTSENVVHGTVPFMSPEHTTGEAATAAADVWCLGASLYHLLTGQHPFGTGEYVRVAERIRHVDPVPPRAINPRIPEIVDHVILRALEKNPAKRYARIAEMADELMETSAAPLA